MTPLGRVVFGAIGLLFVTFVAGMIYLAVGRDAGSARSTLERAGWEVQPTGRSAWTAQHTVGGERVMVHVAPAGPRRNSTVWTSIRLGADTGADDVLLTPKLPGFVSADGPLARMMGAQGLPPRWNGGGPALQHAADVLASDDAAARRWLTADAQAAYSAYLEGHQPVSVRITAGAIEARWAASPESATEIERVVTLLQRIRGSARTPR